MADFVPGMPGDVLQDFKQHEEEKKKDMSTIVETLDGMTFFSWGYTPPLKLTRGDKVEYKQLKIKSVGVGQVIEEYQHKLPIPPATLKTHKADSDVARSLNQKHSVVVWEINEADPAYLKLKQKHETEASQMILLHGLAYDLKGDNGETVLNGASLNEPSKVINPQAALARLANMGFSSNHFGQIVKAVRELTDEVEKQEDAES